MTGAWIDNPAWAEIQGQGGAGSFLQRYAVQPHPGPHDGARAMRMSLAHQNPMVALGPLPPNQQGPLVQPTWGLVGVDRPNVLVWALEPAEEGGDHGMIVRLREVAGVETTATIDLSVWAPTFATSTSLIETDREPFELDEGRIIHTFVPNEMFTLRFLTKTHVAPPVTQSPKIRKPSDTHLILI